MTKAFVFGKFMPFHKGHEAMIRFALTQCDLLTVLICCSDQEKLSPDVRKRWLQTTFASIPGIEIVTLIYHEHELPNTSVTSAPVSAVWATKFKELLPTHSLVITSEPYGELVAGFMKIRHIPFDPEKKLHPVSATRIRANTMSYWHHLPSSVKEDLIIKVVILGTESTGKTTLTQRLASHFNCSFVLEAGRDIVADSNVFDMQDLQLIATEHAARIVAASEGDSPLLIIDTDIHITLSYAQYALREVPRVEAAIFDRNRADLYLYLNNDVPYVQDGTRLSEAERDLLDNVHRSTLQRYGIAYEEVTGDWDDRFNQSILLIEKLIENSVEDGRLIFKHDVTGKRDV